VSLLCRIMHTALIYRVRSYINQTSVINLLIYYKSAYICVYIYIYIYIYIYPRWPNVLHSTQLFREMIALWIQKFVQRLEQYWLNNRNGKQDKWLRIRRSYYKIIYPNICLKRLYKLSWTSAIIITTQYTTEHQTPHNHPSTVNTERHCHPINHHVS